MELRTKTEDDPNVETLTEDFTAHGTTVPKGFTFDGASAPRLFWGIIPPFKCTKKAACLHDWNCRNAQDASDRKMADKLFHTMLLEAGLSKARALIGYIGVRLGARIGIGIYYKD